MEGMICVWKKLQGCARGKRLAKRLKQVRVGKGIARPLKK